MAEANQPDKSQDMMGYETQTEQKEVVTPSISVQEQVNTALKEVTVGEDGKLQYPTDMDPLLKSAVASEKKYRDTQSSFTKGQINLTELEAENIALREQIANNSQMPLELTQEDADRLNDLKFTDPEAWRKEINTLETSHSKKNLEALNEVTADVRTKAGQQFEMNRRGDVLARFNEGRENPINDEVITNDIPPRITNKLNEGKISFEDFLSEVDSYLSKGKTVNKEADPKLPELHKRNGGSTPAHAASGEDELNYVNMTF